MKDQIHAVLVMVGVVAGICGVIWLRAAVTLEQHVGAIALIAVAASFLFGAYKMKPDQTASDLESLGEYLGSKDDAKQAESSKTRSNAI